MLKIWNRVIGPELGGFLLASAVGSVKGKEKPCQEKPGCTSDLWRMREVGGRIGFGGPFWPTKDCQKGVHPISETHEATLVARRDALLGELAAIGEFRPGSLQSRYRRCGKPTCHCATHGDPGHGPKWVLTRTVDGARRNWSIPEAAVANTQAQVAEYKRFRQLTRELTEVSEQLCTARLARSHPAEPGKRGRRTARSRRG